MIWYRLEHCNRDEARVAHLYLFDGRPGRGGGKENRS